MTTAWGRKGRIAMQVFGSAGTILYDQERMNEFQLFTHDGSGTEQGFRTVLTAPGHPPYERFIPAPGHGLGFNELKIIECHELLRAIGGQALRNAGYAVWRDNELPAHGTSAPDGAPETAQTGAPPGRTRPHSYASTTAWVRGANPLSAARISQRPGPLGKLLATVRAASPPFVIQIFVPVSR